MSRPAATGGLLPLVVAALLAFGCGGPRGPEPVTPAPAGSRPIAGSGISREQDRALPPISPPGLRADLAARRVVIAWQPVGLEIVKTYRVVRLEPDGPATLADVPADPARELARSGPYAFTDPRAPSAGRHTYEVSAIDHDGNASAPSRVSIDVRP